MGDFIHFSEFIPKALARYKLNREARAALVCARFRDLLSGIVGEDAAKEGVKPKYFKNGILVVTVPSSIWAQQVYVHRHELLHRLNLYLEKEWVKDLRTIVESAEAERAEGS